MGGIQSILMWANDCAPAIVGYGLVLLLAYQAYQWQKDKRRANQLRSETSPQLTLIKTPPVSILVPAWNEAAMIERHIQSFLQLRYPNKELILCAGGRDGTFDLASQYASSKVTILIQIEGQGKQAALQQCLEHAAGDILFLADADGLLDDHSFERALGPLVEKSEQASSGLTRPLPDQYNQPFALYQWYAEQYSNASTGEYTPVLRGCNGAINRKALEKAGGFSRQAKIGTDDQLSVRLQQSGIPICFVRQSQVANEYPIALRSYIRQQTRWLRVSILRSFAHPAWNSLQTGIGFLIYFIPVWLILFTPLLGKISLYFALAWFGFMVISRIRVMEFGRLSTGVKLSRKTYAYLPLYLLVDVYTHLLSPLQLLFPPARWKW